MQKQLESKYFLKTFKLQSGERIHHMFLYNGYLFTLSENNDSSITFTNTVASYSFEFENGEGEYSGKFPYFSFHDYFYAENYKRSYSDNNIIKNYETATEFYSNLDSKLVIFNDDNKEIRLKCSDINNVRISHDNMKVSKGHPIVLTFYDEYYEVTFDETQW